jgi:hypothetical protein
LIWDGGLNNKVLAVEKSLKIFLFFIHFNCFSHFYKNSGNGKQKKQILKA